MIVRLASKGASFLCRNSETPAPFDLYQYGLECILNECISDICILSIGLLFHMPLHMLVWAGVFTVCRINMGGWHAPNHFLCISCSVLAGLIPLIIYKAAASPQDPLIYTLTLPLYLLLALVRLPLHSSRHITSARRRLSAKAADISLILFLLVLIVSGYNSSYFFFAYIALTEAVAMTLFIQI